MNPPNPFRPMLLAVAFCACLAAAQGDGWFGLKTKATAGGSFWSPRVESIVVAEVVPSSPAGGQQIKAGDSILEIEGMPVRGAKGDDLKSKMKKAVGEKLHLKLQRPSGEVYAVELVAVPKPKDFGK